MDQLEKAKMPSIRHGACLGLGLIACGAHIQKVSDKLFKILAMEETVSGEAASIGIGMV